MKSSEIEVFRAKRIHTMCASRPVVDHVAVQDGRIVATGTLEEVSVWGDYTLNEQFADHFLLPGFVEGHSHLLEGAFWQYTYVGYFDRRGPDGKMWSGLKDIASVIARLQDFAKTLTDPDGPIVAWGFDPIYFDTRRMLASDLDKVATGRPVMVMHASGHMLNANSFILDQADITADTNAHGVLKDDAGQPTGELQEIAAMFPALKSRGSTHSKKPVQ